MPTKPPNARPSKPQAPWATPSKAAAQRLRGRRGVEERRRILREEPLCRMCLAEGKTRASVEVDHITPLARGGSDERSNKQALCGDHHRAKSIAERRGGAGQKSSSFPSDTGGQVKILRGRFEL